MTEVCSCVVSLGGLVTIVVGSCVTEVDVTCGRGALGNKWSVPSDSVEWVVVGEAFLVCVSVRTDDVEVTVMSI